MIIEDKRIVAIHYRLTNNQGDELDTSAGRDPLVYMHGTGGMIPGLEKELTGKEAGDQLQVTVAPADAYGEYNPELIQMVPMEAFQGVEKVEPGMQFEARGPEGQVQLITVEEVSEENVKVNANHPLAGETLNFDVTIESVREATEEELAHGHAH